MNIVYIGLGSNIEPRKTYLLQAIESLEKHEAITVKKQSSIYETEPVDYADQDKFLNMAIQIETSLSNIELLEYCQEIERKLGRNRTENSIEKGPRTIDLDILMFNNENRDLGRLRIPHPRLHERAFVIVPLNEIAPDQVLPTSGKRIEDLYDSLPSRDLKGVVKWTE